MSFAIMWDIILFFAECGFLLFMYQFYLFSPQNISLYHPSG